MYAYNENLEKESESFDLYAYNESLEKVSESFD